MSRSDVIAMNAGDRKYLGINIGDTVYVDFIDKEKRNFSIISFLEMETAVMSSSRQRTGGLLLDAIS